MRRSSALDLHLRLERGFEAWGRFVYRRRIWVLLASLALLAGLASQVGKLRADNSIESLLRANDPARHVYDAFRNQFGRDDHLVLAIQAPRIFDLEFLERLRALHLDLERNVPHIEEITSLINGRLTRGEGDKLIVRELLDPWPTTAAELAQIREWVWSAPALLDNLVTRDERFAAISIEPALYSSAQGGEADALAFEEPSGEAVPLSERELGDLVDATLSVMDQYREPDFELFLSGAPYQTAHLTQTMMRDSATFLGLACLTMMGLLLALFRRVSGVLLPFAVVGSALLASFGAMAWLGVPDSVAGQVLPNLLVAVGVCNAIHLLTLVYQRLELGESREESLVFALGHSGLPVLLTSVTTGVGLLSFTAADIGQVYNFGLTAPVGIALAFLFSVSLLPALIALSPLSGKCARTSLSGLRRLVAFLDAAGRLAYGKPKTVLCVSAALLAMAALGLLRLEFSQYSLRWFPPEDRYRASTELIDAKFGGGSGLEIVIDGGRENALHDPELLRRVGAAMAFAERFESGPVAVGKAVSVVDIARETHRALNENRPDFYRIPEDPRLLAQEMLLFENSGSDDLEDVVDSQFRYARLRLRVPVLDAMYYPTFIRELEQGLGLILGPQVEFSTTGLTALLARSWSVVNISMVRSYLMALAIITPLMMLLLGSPRRGLLAMIPNVAPIVATLGMMGWLGFPIDNSSLLLGCILLGLAVDDTIHFMHRFHRYFVQSGDVAQAISQTLRTTGVALLFTTLVLTAGFGVMVFAYMGNAVEFGVISVFAIAIAFFADVLIAPALMTLYLRGRRRAPPLYADSEAERSAASSSTATRPRKMSAARRMRPRRSWLTSS